MLVVHKLHALKQALKYCQPISKELQTKLFHRIINLN